MDEPKPPSSTCDAASSMTSRAADDRSGVALPERIVDETLKLFAAGPPPINCAMDRLRQALLHQAGPDADAILQVLQNKEARNATPGA
jgi:hypothetical protein